jgi:alpha-beta hydrolase superfamily lysophospholipase
MQKKAIKLFSIAAAGTCAFMSFGWSFFELMVHGKYKKKQSKKKWFQLYHTRINHPRYKFEREYEQGKAWCREQKLQDRYIRSVDGLRLHAYYLPAEHPKRILLLSHGYKGSGFGDFAYTARFLHENGCSLLFIDQRCCGESEGEYITFGARERYDIQRWAYYISKRNTKRLPIYLYGESMGAAAILMASGRSLPSEVKGLIADCGFCSMKRQLRDMAANWFHLNWIELLLLRVDFFCKVLGGFSMKEADTEKALKKNRIPVLFFHGAKDSYVKPENSLHNYSICQAEKELVIIPEARHLCSAYEAPELYRSQLLKFFEHYDKSQK